MRDNDRFNKGIRLSEPTQNCSSVFWRCTMLLLVFFSTLSPNNGMGADSKLKTSTDFTTEMAKFDKNTKTTLMLVPPGMSFRIRIDEFSLRNVSCIYESINNINVVNQISKILEGGFLKYDNEIDKNSLEFRIGVFLENSSGEKRAFYFEDWSGYHEIRGFSDSFGIVARSDTSVLIRSSVSKKYFRLIESNGYNC